MATCALVQGSLQPRYRARSLWQKLETQQTKLDGVREELAASVQSSLAESSRGVSDQIASLASGRDAKVSAWAESGNPGIIRKPSNRIVRERVRSICRV